MIDDRQIDEISDSESSKDRADNRPRSETKAPVLKAISSGEKRKLPPMKKGHELKSRIV